MERFSVGDVVTVVSNNGREHHLTLGETRIVTKVDATSGYVRVTGCDEWLWDGRFKRLEPPKPSVKDVDGNSVTAGDVVECVYDLNSSHDIVAGCRYKVIGVCDRYGGTLVVNDARGCARSWSRGRFRKLAPTPLDKREDA